LGDIAAGSNLKGQTYTYPEETGSQHAKFFIPTLFPYLYTPPVAVAVASTFGIVIYRQHKQFQMSTLSPT